MGLTTIIEPVEYTKCLVSMMDVGPRLNIKTIFPCIWIPMLKIRR